MVKQIISLLVFLSIAGIQACYYDIESELYPNGNCNSTDFTYGGRVKGIIADNCLEGCHSGPTPTEGLDLSTYEGVRTAALNGSLVSALKGINGYTKMPYNTSGLPSCEISAIEDWVNAGANSN